MKKWLKNNLSFVIYALFYCFLLTCTCLVFTKMTSYLPAYILIIVFSVISFIFNNLFYKNIFFNTKNKVIIKLKNITKTKLEKYDWILILIFALLFTFLIILGNYHTTFEKINTLNIILINFIIAPFGVFLIWEEILRFLAKLAKSFTIKEKDKKFSSQKILLISWAVISTIFLLNLIFVNYPGIINGDATKQINQALKNSYSNHYSFWITLIMKFFLECGNLIFSNYSIGIFMYCAFQVFILSLSFALIITTVYQLNLNKVLIIILGLWFCIMPYHTIMSNTMYTDTLFTASIIFFTIFCFRYLKNIGNQKLNLIFSIISALCICLFRPNGIYVIILCAIFLLIIFLKNKNLKLLKFSIWAVLIAALIIQNPVLDVLNVEKTDIINHISVPAQQVSKVLTENKDLTQEQIDLIDNVVPAEKIKNLFNRDNFDNIKFYVRDHGNQQFLNENLAQFIMLYINIGLKHPFEYVIAWADLTKDYWSPYKDQMSNIQKEFLGFDLKIDTLNFKDISTAWNLYNINFSNYLGVFQSIGLHFWFLLLAFFIALIKKDKILIFTFLPCLFVAFSIIIASPVQGEIRYMYAMFCLLPFLWTAVFCNNRKIKEIANNE